LLLASFTYFLVVYSNSRRSTDVVRLNVPFPAIDFAPFYVAKSKGWLEESLSKVGGKPEYLPPFQSIPVTFESLATNRVDMVMTSEVPPIINKASGVDVKIAWLSCTLNSEVIVRKESPVTNLSDLVGTKIGTMVGSDSHYWLVRNFEGAGIPRNRVDFVNLTPPDARAAFNSSAIEAWATFPPFSTIELVGGNAKIVDGIKAPIQVVLVARGGFSNQRADLARAVIDALQKAKEWIVLNPSEARVIVAQETNLPQNVVEAAWGQLDWSASLNEAMVDSIQVNADFLLKEGLIRKKVDVRSELVLELSK
jgi:sulfonate transport system substrate-binding protein